MAMLAAALPYIMAGTAVLGGVSKGISDEQGANILRFNAGQAKASAQRVAIDVSRQTQFKQSRLRALAAASGGSTTDTTIQDLASQIGTEGEYRRLSAMYQGDVQAQGDNLKAGALADQASADVASGVIQGASSAFGARTSFFDKYAATG